MHSRPTRVSICQFVRTDIRFGSARLPVNIFANLCQGKAVVEGLDGPARQMKVAMLRVNKTIRQVFNDVVAKFHIAFGFVPDSRPA